jgi:hypothetical protein
VRCVPGGGLEVGSMRTCSRPRAFWAQPFSALAPFLIDNLQPVSTTVFHRVGRTHPRGLAELARIVGARPHGCEAGAGGSKSGRALFPVVPREPVQIFTRQVFMDCALSCEAATQPNARRLSMWRGPLVTLTYRPRCHWGEQCASVNSGAFGPLLLAVGRSPTFWLSCFLFSHMDGGN